MQTAFRFLLFIALSANLWASGPVSPWFTQDADKKVIVNVELFLSSKCPYCHKEDVFFQKIEAQAPWLHVSRFIINDDKNALIRFNQLLLEQQMDDFAVPSAFFCNSRWVGFESVEATGNDLLYALNYCKQQIERKGILSDSTVNVLKRWANAHLLDSSMTENPGALRYISIVALFDAFNPCALFSIAVFFALLFVQERGKGQILAGSLFILTVGATHYFQQAFMNTFFELLPWLRIPAALTGILTLYVTFQHFSRKAVSCLFLLLSVLLTAMIQLYQQACVMNWSYIFEQWLFKKHLNHIQAGLLQLSYQIVYLLPLIFTLLIYLIFINAKRYAKYKQGLNIAGLLILISSSLYLLVYPYVLSNLSLSVFNLLIIGLLAFVLNKSKWTQIKKVK